MFDRRVFVLPRRLISDTPEALVPRVTRREAIVVDVLTAARHACQATVCQVQGVTTAMAWKVCGNDQIAARSGERPCDVYIVE